VLTPGDIDLVRRSYDALNRRDLDAYLELMHEDVVAEPRMAAMEGTYHGHDGIRLWWDSTLGAFPDLSIELLEIDEVGSGVLTTVRLRGRGADSKTPVDQTVWTVVMHRDGKATWWGAFTSRDEALAVAERRSTT
jgi:ketosteroid isomerase-like protein